VPKTVWIIDGAYMMKSSPGKVDYLRLKNLLVKLNGDALKECFYLNSIRDTTSESQDAFHTWLKLAPPSGPKFRVQLYKLKQMNVCCPGCNREVSRDVQKGVDVGIATLVLKLAAQEQYDRLILSTGDGDFEDAIDYVKSELHKEIWIAGFSDSISADLQSYSDNVIFLNDYWKEIEKENHRESYREAQNNGFSNREVVVNGNKG
jgi:uncharacterized LabA/DUF88 family protein